MSMRIASLLLFCLVVPQLFMGVAAVNNAYATGLEKPVNYFVLSDSQSDAVPSQEMVVVGSEPTVQREDWKFDLIWPVLDYENISSDYGYRNIVGCPACSNNHKGIDFPGSGEVVFAIMDAEVVDVGWEGTYGYRVVLRHTIFEELQYTTIYAHLQESKVTEWLQPGMEIPQGQVIGISGDTGLSTGPHLHFEVLENGEHLDPLEFYDYHLK